MDDTVESLSMKFGLRYANLGRFCRDVLRSGKEMVAPFR